MSNYELVRNSNIGESTTTSDKFIALTEASGKMVYKHANYYAYNDKKAIVSVLPASAIPPSLSSASVDFRIENPIDVIQYPSLQISLLNSSGANASVVCAPLWIESIKVLAQNGGKEIFSTTGEDIFHSNFFLNRDQFESQCTALQMSTAYANTATVIANTGTLVMKLPLYGFWKAVGLAPCGLNSPIVIRIKFAPTSLVNISGTALTCTNLQLLIRGKTLKQSQKMALREIYTQTRIPLSLSHLVVDRIIIPQNLSSNQTINIPLTGIRGACAFISFTVKLATDSILPNGQITYIDMVDYDIQNGQSASLLGSYRRDILTAQIDWSNNFANNAYNSSNFHFASFCADPRGTYANGQVSGFAILSGGNEKLVFTTPVGLASASYIVEIRGYMYANLMLENGQLKSVRD